MSIRFGQYVRVSSKEQAGPDTTSIAHQLTATAALVQPGEVLVDTYCDDKPYADDAGHRVEPSGERADRPEFRRMLADLKAGRITGVLAFHEWRLYRDFPPFTDFIMVARKVKPVVRLVYGSWVEQFAVFGAWMGKADNDHRRAQTNKGMWGKAYKGFSPTTIPHFYRSERDAKGNRASVTLREEYRAWLDELARLFLSGLSYLDIALSVAPDPLTGLRPTKAGVRLFLHNPFMYGDVQLGRRSTDGERDLVKGTQPAAWDAHTLAALRLECARRRAVGHAVPHTNALCFSGLLRCGHPGCGAVMSGNKGAGNRRWPQYGCQRAYLIRRGVTIRGTPHAPNSLSERYVRLALQELGRGITERNAPALLAAYTNVPALDDPHAAAKLAGLRSELVEVEAELASLPATAKRSRTEREGDAAKLLSKIQALEQAAVPAAPVMPPAHMVAALIDFYASDDLLARPAATLRQQVQTIFGVLYFRDRQLVPPPAL